MTYTKYFLIVQAKLREKATHAPFTSDAANRSSERSKFAFNPNSDRTLNNEKIAQRSSRILPIVRLHIQWQGHDDT